MLDYPNCLAVAGETQATPGLRLGILAPFTAGMQWTDLELVWAKRLKTFLCPWPPCCGWMSSGSRHDQDPGPFHRHHAMGEAQVSVG